jgi:L-alanine-DL-glutamate epimerase-like enolase superfamily enzyme
MKITAIDSHVLLAPDMKLDATSSAQDSFIVEIHTDEGISGIGETDVNPWIARACVEAPGTHTMGQSLRDMLIGEDPLDPPRLWEKLYVGSAMNGRRGAVINAIGALDIALWDICGKAAGVPVYQLLGGAAKDAITPYASLQPDTRGFDEYKRSIVAWAERAKAMGFRAAKLELTFDGPYAHVGLHEPDHRTTEVIEAVRAAVGDDMVIMVDVQYMWDDVERAARTIRSWRDFNLFFVETPLRSDDLDGYARLHDLDVGTPIAAGEWLTTRFEFIELMDHGKVDIAQPDIGRVGGLTEARRVAALAADRGLTIVPHLWKTGVSVAAAAQFAAATPNCPFVEFLPPELSDSPLRRELTLDNFVVVDGRIPLPSAPGIGVEINREALRRFAAA